MKVDLKPNEVVVKAGDTNRFLEAKVHSKLEDIKCLTCKKWFKPRHSTTRYCSTKCQNYSNVKDKTITKELLEPLIWEYGFTKTASIFNYSDNGIKKRAISLGCVMPPPYFHVKILLKETRLEAYYNKLDALQNLSS